ncbi:MAG: hypothetical protein M0T77_07525 [Actinomycetota bacterium]|nr:hypothetical protein [Actinomycetota bacterium]
MIDFTTDLCPITTVIAQKQGELADRLLPAAVSDEHHPTWDSAHAQVLGPREARQGLAKTPPDGVAFHML